MSGLIFGYGHQPNPQEKTTGSGDEERIAHGTWRIEMTNDGQSSG
jgi:hypothetical protein